MRLPWQRRRASCGTKGFSGRGVVLPTLGYTAARSRRAAVGRCDCGLPGRRAHNGRVGRIIGTILGAILAVWLAVTVGGGIFATLKTFLIIGLIAMAVFIVVWLVARRPRRG